MEGMMEKVSTLRNYAKENSRNLTIQVDGGVKPGKTAELSAKAGANWFVSGSGIIKAEDRAKATSDLYSALELYPK